MKLYCQHPNYTPLLLSGPGHQGSASWVCHLLPGWPQITSLQASVSSPEKSPLRVVYRWNKLIYIKHLEQCQAFSMYFYRCFLLQPTLQPKNGTAHHFPNMCPLLSFLVFCSNGSLCLVPFSPPKIYPFFTLYLEYQLFPWNFHLKDVSFSEFKTKHSSYLYS